MRTRTEGDGRDAVSASNAECRFDTYFSPCGYSFGFTCAVDTEGKTLAGLGEEKTILTDRCLPGPWLFRSRRRVPYTSAARKTLLCVRGHLRIYPKPLGGRDCRQEGTYKRNVVAGAIRSVDSVTGNAGS